MRFVDEARVCVSSGAGGNGCRSFRREKHVAFGGPDGGDGGRGGDVILVATTRRSTLLELKGRTLWRAKRGEHGRGKQQTGSNGEHAIIEVPVGTRVFDDDTDEILADLTEHEQHWVAAQGGKGGKGGGKGGSMNGIGEATEAWVDKVGMAGLRRALNKNENEAQKKNNSSGISNTKNSDQHRNTRDPPHYSQRTLRSLLR